MRMPDQTRNLNPTPEAVAAMWLHGDAYSKFGGGGMDFWTARTKSQQDNCKRMVAEILAAHAKHNG